MNHCLDNCSASAKLGAKGGAVIGGVSGLAFGLWTCIEFVQPALADVNGISRAGSIAITTAIALFGGLEVSVVAGAGVVAAVGLIITPVIVGAGYCLSKACTPREDRVNRNAIYSGIGFFQEERAVIDENPLILSNVV